MRTPQNRIKSWTGTVHFTTGSGYIACGAVKTSPAYLNWTIEDVTCQKCIRIFGADEVTGAKDPVPTNPHIEKRAAERAARRLARHPR